jgi:DNA-binding phage protein
MRYTTAASSSFWAAAPSKASQQIFEKPGEHGMSSRPAESDKIRRLTKPVQEVLRRRLQVDSRFAGNLLGEAIGCLLRNEVVVAQLLLRDLTNGTVGFASLARETGILEKSLMRMLSAKGNPQASNLFLIIDALQRLNGLRLQVRAV